MPFCYLYITYRPCHCILLWDLQKNMDNAGEEKETQLCSTFKQPESLPKFSLGFDLILTIYLTISLLFYELHEFILFHSTIIKNG